MSPSSPGDPSSPPPVGSASAPAKALKGSFDVLDVLLFFIGFFVVVAVASAVPSMPPKAGFIPGALLVLGRHRVWPPKPRVARPGTTLVGVLVGLAVIASVLLFAGAGIGFARLAEPEPDWSAYRAERLADMRRHSIVNTLPIFGDPANVEAEFQRLADEETARERQSRRERRGRDLGGSLKLTGVGALLVACAFLAERARTRPVEGPIPRG